MNLKIKTIVIWSYIYHDKQDNDTRPGDIAVYMQNAQYVIMPNRTMNCSTFIPVNKM